jgi:serine/threonine-protein kinase RsbW
VTSEPDVLFELRIELPSAVAAMEEFFCSFRRQHGSIARPGEHFTAELLLREAMSNAVIHGSGGNPSAKIRCRIRRRGEKLVMVVQDTGPGFNWRSIRGREAAVNAVSGRGLTIYRKYADRFRFNDQGNCVTLIKTFSRAMVPGKCQ